MPSIDGSAGERWSSTRIAGAPPKGFEKSRTVFHDPHESAWSREKSHLPQYRGLGQKGHQRGQTVFDTQENLLAHWPEIKMANIACSACLTINEDASRFAIALRKDGTWQIQVHNIRDEKLELIKTFVGPETFGLESDPVQVAISPDGETLVYSFGGNSFVLYNLSRETELFEYRGRVQSLQFSRGGQYIYARRQTEVLIWDVYNIEGGFRNFLAPNENAAIDFSPGGEYVAVAFRQKFAFIESLPWPWYAKLMFLPLMSQTEPGR